MEFKGKSVEEAIETGLKTLGITYDQAEIAITTQPKKGFLGIIKSLAVVDVKKKEEISATPKKEEKVSKKEDSSKEVNTEKASDFVREILVKMEIEADVNLVEKDGEKQIVILAKDSSQIIGYRGEILDALQTLAGAIANIGNKDYKKVVVDCENYRDKREDTLIKLAHRLEEKATELKREVMLEPMNPFERRIIHTALSESTTVTTRSDGKEPNRYVVIVPNDKDEFSRPYNAGRNNSDHAPRKNFKKGGNGNKGGYRKGGRPTSGGQKKSQSISFGTYLGNSLKDENK